jgi:galactokinase/mevalonate kinase-like predicted kinase
VRLDIAGGWTDTPPFCIEYGGCVVNVAVDLNGQPPIQVFGRISGRPGITIRSIDLGIEDRVETYGELEADGQIGSGFSVARAAFALAGFVPRFHAKGGYASLSEQLRRDFGGGIEISMLAAVPKGSGLGTSSILGATLLGTLSELCGIGWSKPDLVRRTLALEQLLTSGGGWQDQAGGAFHGAKILETEPGLLQAPVVRWLPDRLFAASSHHPRVLLYYTGLTRTAHDILAEIVRGLFLNSARHLAIIDEIGRNARLAAESLQTNDWPGLCEAVRRSWRLNQMLDPGTNPPAVARILSRIDGLLEAVKLLGAGGGGYLLLLAKDVEAAGRIRSVLSADPPNARARFVAFQVSDVGFQVTRS